MVVQKLKLCAELENISQLRRAPGAVWYVKIQCGHCNEIHENIVGISEADRNQISGSRGNANFVFRCKLCKRESSSNIVPNSASPYVAKKGGEVQEVLAIESRGISITEWFPRGDWIANTLKSGGTDEETLGQEWAEIDLEEDWADYDEAICESVAITDVKATL